MNTKPVELNAVLSHVESAPFLSDFDMAVLEQETRTRSDTARLLARLGMNSTEAGRANDDPVYGLMQAASALHAISKASHTGLVGDSGDIQGLLKAMTTIQAVQDVLQNTVHLMLKDALRPEFPSYIGSHNREHAEF